MTGKEYVQEAIDKAQRVLSEIRGSGKLDGEPCFDAVAKACSDLEQVKNRATLKTKAGLNLALPIFEAAGNLDDAWSDAQGGSNFEDVKACLDAFAMAAEVLVGALKERTVVMT